jgi:preprotein translocase subunit SecG
MKCAYLTIGYVTLIVSVVFNFMGFKYSFFSTLFLWTSLLLSVISLYYSKRSKNKNDDEDSDYHLYV